MTRITAASLALSFSATFLVAAPAEAQDLPPRGQQQQALQTQAGDHLVVQGNTLWDLAQQFYGNPFDWRRIWEANRDRVDNPDLIYPGQLLLIPDEDGNLIEVMVAPGNQPPTQPQAESDEIERTMWYPRAEMEREFERVQNLVPAVSEQVVEGAPFVVDAPNQGVVGRVIGFGGATDTRITRESARMFDRLFVEFDGSVAPGTRLQAYRVGRNIEGTGYVAQPTAVIEVQAMAGDRPVVEVVRVYGRLLEGDLLRPIDSYDGELGVFPTRVSGGGSVQVVGYADGEADVVGRGAYLFVPTPAGADIGDEYEVRLPGSARAEGVFQIVNVGSDYATGWIINIRNAVFEPGVQATLSRKMPTG